MGHSETPVTMVQPASQVRGLVAVLPPSRGTQIWCAWFARVLLFDDDAHKACPGEEGNMIRVPCWDDNNGQCVVLKELVESVLEVGCACPLLAYSYRNSGVITVMHPCSTAAPPPRRCHHSGTMSHCVMHLCRRLWCLWVTMQMCAS